VAIKAYEARLNCDQEIASDTVLSVEGKRYTVCSAGKSNRRPEEVQSERRNRRSAGETLTCYYCQRKGHQSGECSKLKADGETGRHVDPWNSPMPAMAIATDMLSHMIFTAF